MTKQNREVDSPPPYRNPPLYRGDGRLGSGIDVVDTAVRGGGHQTVLVGPCQMNQKTYQRAQVGAGLLKASSCLAHNE